MELNPIVYSLICVCLTSIQPSFISPTSSNNLKEIKEYHQTSHENISLEKTFSMNSYFQHLYKNIPENAFGSCGFVSLVSCLSYYDSYYNDTIINDKFDIESHGASIEEVVSTSPGVKFSKFPSDSIKSNVNIRNFIANNKQTDFQYSLIYHYNTQILKKSLTDTFVSKIGMWDYQKLLDSYYGKNKFTFNYISSTIYGSDIQSSSVQSHMRQYVYDMLEEGYPVILHVASDNSLKDYHSIVAYNYDNSSLSCNFGYQDIESANQNLIILPYQQYIKEAGRLVIEGFYETHSTNFVVNDRPYCGCGFSE